MSPMAWGTDLDRQTDKGSTRWTTVNVKSTSSATFDPVDPKLCFLLLQALLLLSGPSSVTHEAEVEGAQATSGSAVTHHTCEPRWADGAGATARLWDYRQLASALMCAHVKFCLSACLPVVLDPDSQAPWSVGPIGSGVLTITVVIWREFPRLPASCHEFRFAAGAKWENRVIVKKKTKKKLTHCKRH